MKKACRWVIAVGSLVIIISSTNFVTEFCNIHYQLKRGRAYLNNAIKVGNMTSKGWYKPLVPLRGSQKSKGLYGKRFSGA
jgi:hypothetical protein